ncbi:pyrroline-5-carboxylate reductase family protein [Rhodovulum sp. DZ06]|uniref:pyrroline-5-carboxylate reductase family protein n=1 Tax=Rhodovulum sp. DZ06 TaxID=3425126 RepID=UPI003D3264AA
MDRSVRIGIIGGGGALGSALARAWIESGTVPAAQVTVSGRSGAAPALADLGVRAVADNAALAAASDVVVLSVPPAAAGGIGIEAPHALVVSVMAGVPMARIAALTGAGRVARAMSSPAAARRLAWSPWCAGPGVTEADRAVLQDLFAATGDSAEVPDEGQIDLFTAMTGPVPGFAAAFAAALVAHAEARGVEAGAADRAVRMLMKGAAAELAEGPPPAAQVQAMIDYAGTTAAGLNALRAAPFQEALDASLDAAAARAREMGKG